MIFQRHIGRDPVIQTGGIAAAAFHGRDNPLQFIVNGPGIPGQRAFVNPTPYLQCRVLPADGRDIHPGRHLKGMNARDPDIQQ